MPCATRNIPLPQLPAAAAAPRVKSSRAARWRAGVLIAVHLIIAARIAHWLTTGSTVSPVEPSESMQTLEQGVVNAGFIFFALAILSTLVFGRFVCGWACHVVALQDLCAWLLKKMGLRPKPFRSRLMMLVPLGAALYMFVWPTFTRVALVPAFEAAGLAWPQTLRRPPEVAGFTTELIVNDLWATFPPWYIAVPFLFVCGFAIVYFLGAKGFCTYGCPYGGFFAPADLVAPVRIRVTDDCEQCGHCTSVCTSNVRVHEEVRDYGMVVDPGCMKCLDCVSVCPNDALYVGLGRPAILAPPPRTKAQADARRAAKARRARQFDFTLPEELAAAALWLAMFVAIRGFLDSVPMLMALGLASIGVYLTHRLWSLLTRPHVRIHGWILKQSGRLRLSSAVFAALVLAVLAVTAWSGVVRWHRWLGVLGHDRLAIPSATLLAHPAGEASPEQRGAAERALRHLRVGMTPADGGYGWGLPADRLLQIAYLQTVLADLPAAARTLERVVLTGNPTDDLLFEIARLHALAGVPREDTVDLFRRTLELHPALHKARAELAASSLALGDPAAAEAVWDTAPPDAQASPVFNAVRAQQAASRGDGERARTLATAAADALDADRFAAPADMLEVAGALITVGLTDRAASVQRRVAAYRFDRVGGVLSAARIAFALGDARAAAAYADDVAAAPHATPGQRLEAGRLRLALGDAAGARVLFEVAAEASMDAPWSLSGVAEAFGALSQRTGDEADFRRAAALLEAAVELAPGAVPLLHDLAAARATLGDLAGARGPLERACDLTQRSELLPAMLAQVCAGLGDAPAAERWSAEAQRRAALLP